MEVAKLALNVAKLAQPFQHRLGLLRQQAQSRVPATDEIAADPAPGRLPVQVLEVVAQIADLLGRESHPVEHDGTVQH